MRIAGNCSVQAKGARVLGNRGAVNFIEFIVNNQSCAGNSVRGTNCLPSGGVHYALRNVSGSQQSNASTASRTARRHSSQGIASLGVQLAVVGDVLGLDAYGTS